jgi:PAS domain S-box-containing protein
MSSTADVTSPPEALVSTSELSRRPARRPDYEAESRAVAELADVLARTPDAFLRRLHDVTARALGASAAGVCRRGERGPLGLVVDTETPQLFTRDTQETLVVPLRGGAVLWAVADRPFDAEDVRLLERLAAFAGAVGGLLESIDELRRSERRAQSLIDATTSIIWWADATGAIVDARRWTEVTGQPHEEMRGWGWLEMLHPADRAASEEKWREGSRRGQPSSMEHRIRRADGEYRWVSATAVPVLDAHGTVREWLGTLTDIDAERRSTNALRESEARFRALANAAPAMLWVTEPDGSCSFLSHTWYEVTGQDETADESAGPRFGWLDAVHPDDRPMVETGFLAANARHERFHMEYRLRHVGGDYRWVLDVGSPRFDADGRYLGYVGSVIDIHARKQAEDQREELLSVAERALGEAELANRAKDEFLTMLGHELRNPLAAVRNAVATATLDASHRDEALAIARRQVEQLGWLVDDLLDVARITQGRITLRREPLALQSVVDRALEATRPFAESRGHTIAVDVPAEPVRVDGDAARLEQVVVNLLSNAVKYTEPGGHIAVSLARDGDDAVIRVRDTGMGIAAHLLPRVFDLFMQGDRPLDRTLGGLGIGLTVARRLVDLHGGRIEALSAGAGAGSEFVVRLRALPAVEELPITARPSPYGGRAAHVLIVEDNPDAAEALSMLLAVLGHRVRVAHDGLAALDAVRTHHPEVVLVDIGLPGMDGYEVARRIRADATAGHPMLVALTGYGRDEDKRRSADAGFDHHLVKPVHPEALDELIRTHAVQP